MRDFISGFAAGFAGGVEKGAAIGLKARSLQDERESNAATLARQIAADKATAEYRSGQLAISGRNATETGRHNLATEGASARTAAETSRHNKLVEIVNSRNATSAERRAAAAELKASGIDAGLEASLGETVPGYVPKKVPGAVTTPPATGAVTPPAVTGAITTPPAVATPAPPPAPTAGTGDKSITEENQLIPALKSAYGEAGDTGEDPDKEEGQ